MLILRYVHRLPAEYDMSRIRDRTRQRGPLWDGTPGLAFKAFSIRENGAEGGNTYASTYLWRDPAAALAFLGDARFRAVIAAFGRPRIETWLPVSVQAGRFGPARGLLRETAAVKEADLADLRAREEETGRRAVSEARALAVFSGLDPATWRLTRFTLTSAPSAAHEDGEDVAYLAAPGWAELS